MFVAHIMDLGQVRLQGQWCWPKNLKIAFQNPFRCASWNHLPCLKYMIQRSQINKPQSFDQAEWSLIKDTNIQGTKLIPP